MKTSISVGVAVAVSEQAQATPTQCLMSKQSIPITWISYKPTFLFLNHNFMSITQYRKRKILQNGLIMSLVA